MEGDAAPDAPNAPAAAAPAPLQEAAEAAAEPPLRRRRLSAHDCLQELRELKGLLDCGALSGDEFEQLKARLLNGD